MSCKSRGSSQGRNSARICVFRHTEFLCLEARGGSGEAADSGEGHSTQGMISRSVLGPRTELIIICIRGFFNSLLYKQEVNNNLVSFVHKVTSRRIECPILGHKLSNEQSTSQNSESSPPSCPTPNTSTILLQQFTPFHITLFDTSHCTTLPLL